MQVVENIINRLAMKEFSKSAIIAQLLLFILSVLGIATCILVSLVQLDITVPGHVEDNSLVVTSQQYFNIIKANSENLSIQQGHRVFPIIVSDLSTSKNGDLLIHTNNEIAGVLKAPVRIVLFKKRIISLLFTKALKE